MSSGDTILSGPDLAEGGQGLDPDELRDGAVVLGHADGQPVLLARRGAERFAIGAKCSHYGGPLAEGLFVDDTIRCPWHHACFSLRTGEALHAPALNPVPCFAIKEQRGRLFVGSVLAQGHPSKERSAPSRAKRQSPESVVIVGAGAAGNAAAEMLRREGYEGRVDIIGADDSVPYDRPNLSKDYLAGNAPEEWIPLRSTEFYAERQISLRLGVRAERLDATSKSVLLSNGETLSYGALILATGADPIRLKLPGFELPHVHYLRTLADSRSIIARAITAKRAVIVGAGFIGLEVAASLRTRGLDVVVVAPEAVPLLRVVGDALGSAIQNLHEARGVVFRLGRKPTGADANFVHLDNGEKLSADLVVVGVGVRPALDLAERAGLATDTIKGGVLVDPYLATSAPGVFAAGDVARWPDARTGERLRIEHWVVAERQGQTAARNALGMSERYEAVPFFWSAHYETSISYVGHAEQWDRVDVEGDLSKGDFAIAFRRAEQTLAIATMGRDATSLLAELAMEARDEARLYELVRSGRQGSAAG